MLINLSNHPSSKWSESQLEGAMRLYGDVIDIPFPNVGSDLDGKSVFLLACDYRDKILEYHKGNEDIVVHVMGEQSFCYFLIRELLSMGIKCVVSTTERVVVEGENGEKLSQFKFCRFREIN